ncbi:MAG: DUF1592 domain-containing protein [Planctomycetaceae bacterium]
MFRFHRDRRFADALLQTLLQRGGVLLMLLALFAGGRSLEVRGEGEQGAADSSMERGAVLYRQQCAKCHGANGEGVQDAFGDALVGDRSLKELTDLISRTMPEGEPKKCVGEEAAAVALYVYDSFYSEIAQARNRPATIEFSRLTVRQYEESIADLLASFTGEARASSQRGLDAEYFNDRRPKREKRVIQRVDPTINFQFGSEGPGEKINKEEFSITWHGSITPPETGYYDFILKTENAGRLYINNTSTPLIDASVKSGDETEYQQSIRLLGGRAYMLKLEYFVFKQKTASIALWWKPPHRAAELIPERALTFNRLPESFVLKTPFPPDDRSIGYERGNAISAEWYQATTYAALEVANHLVKHLDRFARTKHDAGDRRQKVQEFCRQFIERAFRRPLSNEDREFYVDRHFAGDQPLETTVQKVLILALKSPKFLYRETGLGTFDDVDRASWVSFALWDSLPDSALMKAATTGQLKTESQLRQQAERMLADPRAKAKLRSFMQQWLRVDHFPELSKDREMFPEFNDEFVADLRTSLDLFVDDVLWSESSDFRRLLSSDEVYLNGRLAKFYGVELPADAPFQKVSLADQQRAGVVTHPFLMSAFGYDRTSSPIHRGVFLARNVLGRRLKPPPIAVTPAAVDLNPSLNTRERVALQTSPQNCQSCHIMINALGFSLEQFDAVGRYRKEELGRPIDASGQYLSTVGETHPFVGSTELAKFLVDSPEVHEAFVEQLFQYTMKQPVRAFGATYLQDLTESFRKNNFNIQKLLIEMAATSAERVK